jgi:hypothetical protein
MTGWIALEPASGWLAFDKHKALLDAIWAGLSESGGQWHYLNLAAESAIWESRQDGSAIEPGNLS